MIFRKRWILQPVLAMICRSFIRAEQVPSDFLVEGMEDIEPAFEHFEGSMYSGLLPMNNRNREGELMFWLFAPDEPSTNNTLTIWLNGGPGCSAFFAGVFFEHGPVTVPLSPAGECCVDEFSAFVYNPHTWASATHMLYVEQPVGVGFSYGGPKPDDEKDVAGDFHAFLQSFYSVFTWYHDYDLFLFGESYAGYYVPSIAHKIYRENRNSDPLPAIPLHGIGIGNGLLDARVQGPIRIDYAYFHGMIDMYTRDVLKELWDQCIDHKSMKEPFHAFNVPDDCGMLSAIPLAAGKNAIPGFPSGPNVYDVTTWDPYAILSGDNSISRFYNNPAMKKKMHSPAHTFWRGCVPGAGRRRLEQRDLMTSLLIDDKPLSMIPYIAELLDGDIRVILYNGDRDMACNSAGTEMLLSSMEWNGADQWYTTERGLWTVDDKPAGYAKSHKNLDYVVLYNSGHLAPYNKPEHALDLITRFLANESFYDYNLPNYGDYLNRPEVDPKKSYLKTTPTEEVLSQSSVSDSLSRSTASVSVQGRLFLPVASAFFVGFAAAYFWQRQTLVAGYRPI